MSLKLNVRSTCNPISYADLDELSMCNSSDSSSTDDSLSLLELVKKRKVSSNSSSSTQVVARKSSRDKKAENRRLVAAQNEIAALRIYIADLEADRKPGRRYSASESEKKTLALAVAQQNDGFNDNLIANMRKTIDRQFTHIRRFMRASNWVEINLAKSAVRNDPDVDNV